MSAVLILLIAFALLALGYIFYGSWVAKQWGVDPTHETPAHTSYDGKDFVPANPAVLMGHHFSSIAGAGPINGPIQAAVFGWVPVFLWIVIGGIFFGAVHDFGALFAATTAAPSAKSSRKRSASPHRDCSPSLRCSFSSSSLHLSPQLLQAPSFPSVLTALLCPSSLLAVPT